MAVTLGLPSVLRRLARSAAGRRGVSLTEMMLVVALVGILASLAPKLFIDVTRFIRMSQARHDIQRDSKNIFILINRNLRQAKASTITISQQSGQPPYSKITFDKYLTDSTVRTMTFYQQDDKLYQVESGSTRPICDNVRYIAFSYPRTDDDSIVSVSLTLEKATYQGRAKALQLAVEKVRVMNY